MMNAERDKTVLSAGTGEPLVSLCGGAAAVADLAFGSVGGQALTLGHGHLAILPTDSLELDLDDPAQRRFGDYELLELIGEGGMGVVYRARQHSLDREVAVKLLAAGPWASREFIERFRREAQNAARMQHPNIVAIYEVGSAEEMHFFSMRLVRGGSLATVLRNQGKLPAARAAELLRTIAEAVDYAHRLGVLHLDLKPANVLIDETGAPHVADFGLARRLDSALVEDGDEVSGTPSYMAPEQASPRTARITPATDIWGLGAILYELVTGQPPFLGTSSQATLELVVKGELTSPRSLVPSLPRDLESIVVRCMARNVADRYPSGRALADDLGRFLEGRTVSARPLNALQRTLRWMKREPKLALTAAFALAALLAGLAATTQQWRRADSNAARAAASASLANERLWQTRIDQAATAVANGHDYDALPGLAANIAEREAQGLDAHDDRLRLAAVERGAPRLIDDIALGMNIWGVGLSPDGSQVAVSTLDERLHVYDTATGKELWQASFKGASHFADEIRLVVLRFSADGSYLIGRNHPGWPEAVTPAGWDEVLFDMRERKVVAPPQERFPKFRDATFSPDGAYAVVRTTDQQATFVRTKDWQSIGKTQRFAPATIAWLVTTHGRHVLTLKPGYTDLGILDPRTLAVRHEFHYAIKRSVTAWASSPDGQTVVVGHRDGVVERIDCATGKRTAIAPNPAGRIGWLTFSPDGKWFGAVSDSGEVLVWDSVSGNLAAPTMHLDATPDAHRDQLLIDATDHTVLASIDMEMALWYLPDATSAPVRLSGEFPNNQAWWLRAFGYDPASGLIANDGGGGELRLWRVQQLAPREALSPPAPPTTLHARSGRIVAVSGSTLRLIDAADGKPAGPQLELPQPAGSAELTADESRLVAVAGPEIFVFDTASWRRGTLVSLPNDPKTVLLSPDSHHALILFADYDGGINRELAQVWDLQAGKPTTTAVPFPPMSRCRYSPNGASVVCWAAGRDRLQAYDATTLQPEWPELRLAKRRGAATRPKVVLPAFGNHPLAVLQARYSDDGSRIYALSIDPVDGIIIGISRLWSFDAATGKQLLGKLLSKTGGADDFAIMPDGSGVVVQREGSAPPLWWDWKDPVEELPGYGNEMAAATLTRTGTMYARSTDMNHVVVTALHGMQWLTPPLPTAVPTADLWREHPTHLAFTGDDSGLVGRTRQGRWLYWDMRPDQRPIESITREAALLAPGPLSAAGRGFTAALPDAERKALRANDPGPPVFIGTLPTIEPLPRPARLPARLFDLSEYYNAPLAGLARSGYLATYRELAPGLHRFLGVDYDARGIIALSVNGFASEMNSSNPPPHAIRGIRPGIRRFAALDLLMTAYAPLLSNERHPYAMVELDYDDGSRARLPVIYRRDVLVTSADETGTHINPYPRIAWRATNLGSPIFDVADSVIYSVRLRNPHPERNVASLTLEATDEPLSTPLIFAITAEPPATAASASASASAPPGGGNN